MLCQPASRAPLLSASLDSLGNIHVGRILNLYTVMQAVRVEKVRPVELLIRSSIETLMVAIVRFWKYEHKKHQNITKKQF